MKRTPERNRSFGTASSCRGRVLVIFGPLLALGVAIVMLAALAGLSGWLPREMYAVAIGTGGIVMLLAIVLFYRLALDRRETQQSLQNVEARVGEIVESAMDAIITVDRDQRIVLVNNAAEAIFGWPRSALLGQPLEKLIPERLRHSHKSHMERFGATGTTSRRMGGQMVIVGLRAGGEEFPIEASISQHNEQRGKFFTVILRDVTERVKAEAALRQSKEELRELAAGAHSVREQEKSRVARELHDELAQSLTALKMDLAWMAEHLPSVDDPVSIKLKKMQFMVDGTVAATRRIAADLRPLMLDDLGLLPAAEWLVKNFTDRTGIVCELAVGSPDLDLQDPHATAIFRILQESLNNVARHAEATQVDVCIDHVDAEVMLIVRDNGRGFVSGGPRKPGSLGLAGLRERAYLLGGNITIETAPGKGTNVEVRIPVGDQAHAS